MKLKKSFVFFVVVIASVCIIFYIFNKKIEPTLEAICTNNAKNVAFKASNESVYEYIKNIKYDDLINLEKNSSGNVTALTANVSEINKLVNQISSKIQSRLEEKQENELTLPLSEIFGIRVIGARGPKIKVWTIVEGNVDVNFKSSFEDAGINQTRHTLYVEIVTNVATVSPLFSTEKQYVNSIMVAESIIISDIPSTYYEINGVENLDTKTTLETINE
jgi:sporulation protein YunB